MIELRDTTRKQIKEIPRLATLPTVAIELTQFIEQQDISVRRILINDEGWQILIDEQSQIADADPERVAFELKRDVESARLISDDTMKMPDDTTEKD